MHPTEAAARNVELIEAALEVRVARAAEKEPDGDGQLSRFQQARIALASIPATAPDKLLASRLSLTDAEMMMLWVLVAAETSERTRFLLHALGAEKGGGIGTRLLSSLTGESGASTTLAARSVLRRLSLIERCDLGGPDVHESRWSWAISRRVLGYLHGDCSVDPILDGIVEVSSPAKALNELATSEKPSQPCDAR